MQDRVGDEFDGTVSSVTGFGLFVQLSDIYVEGLVHITALQNDYYQFDPVRQLLRGERSGVTYHLGDTVRVRVVRVDLDERKIDLQVVDGSHVGKPGGPGKGARAGSGKDGKSAKGGRGNSSGGKDRGSKGQTDAGAGAGTARRGGRSGGKSASKTAGKSKNTGSRSAKSGAAKGAGAAKTAAKPAGKSRRR